MHYDSIGSKITQFIHQHSSAEMFEEISPLIDQAFRLANDDSESRIKHCSLRQSRKRSQDRAIYLQEALHDTHTSWSVSLKATKNNGESYTELLTDKLLVTAHVLPYGQRWLRTSDFRKTNAHENHVIEQQLELFNSSEEYPTNYEFDVDKLNILIIAYAPHPEFEQDSPATIKVCVPYSTCNRYHLSIDIDDLIAGFSDSKSSLAPQDNAWPKLRDLMRQVEETGSAEEQNE